MWRVIIIGLPYDAEKWRDSDSTGEKDGWLAEFLWSVKEPISESIWRIYQRQVH